MANSITSLKPSNVMVFLLTLIHPEIKDFRGEPLAVSVCDQLNNLVSLGFC